METKGGQVMCAGCIDVVSLIHDENYVADSYIAKTIIENTNKAIYAATGHKVEDHDIATFMIVVGGQLLNWEKQ